ncbi:hypothetical protein MBLNU230_g4786t1 [Neophaeotheca triangularis]
MDETQSQPEDKTSRIGPEKSLPHGDAFTNSEEYVESLLDLVGTHHLLRTLCGGVHILDFFTSTPDLYSQVVPEDWRHFFRKHNMMNILHLLMREDLSIFDSSEEESWREGPQPPSSLIAYIRLVRKHLLQRDAPTPQTEAEREKPMARHVSLGMKVKKVHEVGVFASYLNDLTSSISSSTGEEISHLVDYGSGQNYLGRALASQPYNKHIVAIESREHNVTAARDLDVKARLAKKEKIMRNKKTFRAGLETPDDGKGLPMPPSEADADGKKPAVQISAEGEGTIQYISHRIEDGNLSDVVEQIVPSSATTSTEVSAKPTQSTPGFAPATVLPSKAQPQNLLVMSLHSCGNLVHHGLRSLTLNPSVKAVAMVGCCYNLITERLNPPTFKLPELRPKAHPRLEKLATACDPHGFPMSERFCTYTPPSNSTSHKNEDPDRGVRLNITARMMAVQAPRNWGQHDSPGFFKRHFYRALLQRIFLDLGIVPSPDPSLATTASGCSPAGHSSGTPIVIGSLRKSCYDTFLTYVRAALDKLTAESEGERGQLFREKTAHLSDQTIEAYEVDYRERHKELSVLWSLMAFSAGVVEAAVVVDRWLWLREQEMVGEAWVEAVFDYGLSPRNLVVVGVKKGMGGWG